MLKRGVVGFHFLKRETPGVYAMNLFGEKSRYEAAAIVSLSLRPHGLRSSLFPSRDGLRVT